MNELTDLQRRTLATLSEAIIPSDDGPGARETTAAAYVELVLTRIQARSFQTIASGLDLLETLATENHGRSFSDCSPSEKAEVISRLKKIPHRLTHLFFTRLVDLTLEGFLCDPVHGGNKDRLGWEYLGYEPNDPGAR